MKAALGDAEHATHGGDREQGPVLAHEREPFGRIVLASRANQAVARARMSRSS
jgi:hypothetical protein